MSGNESEEVEEMQKKRKGVRKETPAALIKRSRVKGLPYKNYKGVPVPGKISGESCRCSLKCFDKIDELDRIQAFANLRDLDTKNEQDIFLYGLIDVVAVKQRRPRTDDPIKTKPKAASYRFHVAIGENKVRVCKKAFMSIYSIKNYALFRLQRSCLSGVIPRDRRGHQGNQRIIPGAVIHEIKQHISSFPVKQSHYASKEYLYLAADLNIKAMFKLYKERFPTSAVKQSFYYKVFKENFDLHFGRPQVDVCCECERLNIRLQKPDLNETAVKTTEAELVVHKRRAKKFYASIKEVEELCKTRDDVLGLSFDYMQNISLPCIPVQEMFYYRQLSLYPFCIKNLKTNESRFYLYHEGVALKGPNETCSFLWQYIQEQVPLSVRELYIFTDACGGQNRNHVMISLCQALVDTGRFDKIYHRLPIRGHSFLPNDRSFGTVKKLLKRRDRYYLPMEICQLICSAHKKFTVSMVKTEDILDFKSWWTKYYKKNSISIETQSRQVPRNEKQHFLVSHFLEFEYSSAQKGCVITRPFIQSIGRVNTFDLRKNRSVIPEMPVEKAYNSPLPINIKKIDDLRRTLQYIPYTHKDFFMNIVENWPNTNDINDNDGD